MKSVYAATALALTLSTSAFAVTNEAGEAEAVGGVVHFTGFITDSTCTVNGMDNPFTESLELGTYVKTDFDAVGQVSTSVPLNLELTDCPESISAVSLTVTSNEGPDDVNPTDYKIADGGAEGVAIRLTDAAGKVIEYGKPSNDYAVKNQSASVNVEAQYVATGVGENMKTGQANLNATFDINYK